MTEVCIKLKTPLDIKQISSLKAGDIVSLSGTVLGARDAAHRRMALSIKNGEKLPVNLKNAVIFYLGPSPAPPGKVSGSIGPTTSARMDKYSQVLLGKGLKAMIGKGKRSSEIKELLKKYKSVYFIAPGGVAAYLSKKVKKIETVAYHDLGPEAIYSLEVENFPLIVAYDIFGGDIFK
ncbi:MAG: TRZ/ATZ family protein [Actinobacteria bacterium]|nr:TRZ/ATZ family protein [Actinomycetota bacterium]